MPYGTNNIESTLHVYVNDIVCCIRIRSAPNFTNVSPVKVRFIKYIMFKF